MESKATRSDAYLEAAGKVGHVLVMTNASGQILAFSSSKMSQVFGYGAGEMVGAKINMLLPDMTSSMRDSISLSAGSADQGAVAAFGHSVMVRGFGHSVPGRRKDGSPVPLDLVITEEWDTVGVRCFNWILRDVSERMKLYEGLRAMGSNADATNDVVNALLLKVQASNHELKIANEDLQKFTSIVAHDLRGPLRRIEAFVGVLQADFLPDLHDDGADILDRIAKGANRMRLMLDSLLQYSRYNSSAIAGKTAKLEDVVRDALSAFDTEALGIKVSVALNGADEVRGDPILLSHVLQNLIGNAVKFRSPVAPAITVEAVQVGQEIRVSVTDNGIGIEPRFAEKIFEMFYRLHDEDAYEGTGIGLTVCRKIVHDHGGHIWLDEAAEDRTRFAFTMSAASAAELQVEKPAAKPRFRVATQSARRASCK